MLVLYRYTELLKVIELTYHRHAMTIAPYFNAIMQFHSQRLLKIIAIAKVDACPFASRTMLIDGMLQETNYVGHRQTIHRQTSGRSGCPRSR